MTEIMLKNIEKNIKKRKNQAFTLIELIIAVFILSLITLASVATFISVVMARKNAVTTSNHVRAAREAIEIMAKNIRMSSRLNYIVGSGTKTIYFYSESMGKCVSYRFSGNALYGSIADSKVAGTSISCSVSDGVVYSYSQMTGSDMKMDGSFIIVKTDTVAKIIGRGTMVVLVDGKYNLQTTISFRNYEGVI